MSSTLAFLGVGQHHIPPKSFFKPPHKGMFQQHASCTAQQQSNSNATAMQQQRGHNTAITLPQRYYKYPKKKV